MRHERCILTVASKCVLLLHVSVYNLHVHVYYSHIRALVGCTRAENSRKRTQTNVVLMILRWWVSSSTQLCKWARDTFLV
jgi:hypothetical protein